MSKQFGNDYSRNSKSKKKKNKNKTNDPTTSNLILTQDQHYPPPPTSKCVICGGIENEDLIILCDGPNCPRETHMYCLKPPLLAVPEGNWYCDVCDPLGTTKHLQDYFHQHEKLFSILLPKTKEDYHLYLQCLQGNTKSWEEWRLKDILLEEGENQGDNEESVKIPLSSSSSSSINNKMLFKDEFDSSVVELIGCKLHLYCTIDERFHTGRIIHRRYHPVFQCYEHLIHFKSGSDGRNAPCLQWCILQEHICAIFGEQILWCRSDNRVYWPGQYYERSQLFLSIFDEHNQKSNKTQKTKTIRAVWSFADQHFHLLDTKRDAIVDLESRNFSERSHVSKAVHMAYLLALSEHEEYQSIHHIYQLQINYKLLHSVDGLTCKSILDMINVMESMPDKTNIIEREDSYTLVAKQWHELYLDDAYYLHQQQHSACYETILQSTSHPTLLLYENQQYYSSNGPKPQGSSIIEDIVTPCNEVEREIKDILGHILDKVLRIHSQLIENQADCIELRDSTLLGEISPVTKEILDSDLIMEPNEMIVVVESLLQEDSLKDKSEPNNVISSDKVAEEEGNMNEVVARAIILQNEVSNQIAEEVVDSASAVNIEKLATEEMEVSEMIVDNASIQPKEDSQSEEVLESQPAPSILEDVEDGMAVANDLQPTADSIPTDPLVIDAMEVGVAAEEGITEESQRNDVIVTATVDNKPSMAISARERISMVDKVAVDISYLASEVMFPLNYLRQYNAMYAFCQNIDEETVSNLDSTKEDDKRNQEEGYWTAESYGFMNWIDEETDAFFRAEQARIEAEEEEKRRKRKEQYEQRKETKLRKKQEEAEKRRQKITEKKQKQTEEEEEEDDDDNDGEEENEYGHKRKRDNNNEDEEELNLETIFNEEWFDGSGRRKTRRLKQQEFEQKQEILALAKKQLKLEKALQKQAKQQGGKGSKLSSKELVELLGTSNSEDALAIVMDVNNSSSDIQPQPANPVVVHAHQETIEKGNSMAEVVEEVEDVILLSDLDCIHWEHRIVKHIISSEIGQVVKFYDSPPKHAPLKAGKAKAKMVEVRTLWGVMTGFDYHFKLVDEESEEYIRFIEGNILLEAEVEGEEGDHMAEDDAMIIQDMIQEATTSMPKHHHTLTEDEVGNEWELFEHLDHLPETTTTVDTTTAVVTNMSSDIPSSHASEATITTIATDDIKVSNETNLISTSSKQQPQQIQTAKQTKPRFNERPSKTKLVEILPETTNSNNGPKKIPKKVSRPLDDDEDRVASLPVVPPRASFPAPVPVSNGKLNKQANPSMDQSHNKETIASTVNNNGKPDSIILDKEKIGPRGSSQSNNYNNSNNNNNSSNQKIYKAQYNRPKDTDYYDKNNHREEKDRLKNLPDNSRDQEDASSTLKKDSYSSFERNAKNYDNHRNSYEPDESSPSDYYGIDRYDRKNKFNLYRRDIEDKPPSFRNNPQARPLSSVVGERDNTTQMISRNKDDKNKFDSKFSSSSMPNDPRLFKRSLPFKDSQESKSNTKPYIARNNNEMEPSGNVTPRFSSDDEEDTQHIAAIFGNASNVSKPTPSNNKQVLKSKEEDDDEDVKNLFQQLKSSMPNNNHGSSAQNPSSAVIVPSVEANNNSNSSSSNNSNIQASASSSSTTTKQRRTQSRFDRPAPSNLTATNPASTSSSSSLPSSSSAYRATIPSSSSAATTNRSDVYSSNPNPNPRYRSSNAVPLTDQVNQGEGEFLTASSFHVTTDYDLPILRSSRNVVSYDNSINNYGSHDNYPNDTAYLPAYPNEYPLPPYDEYGGGLPSYQHHIDPPMIDYRSHLYSDELAYPSHHTNNNNMNFTGQEYYDYPPLTPVIDMQYDDPYHPAPMMHPHHPHRLLHPQHPLYYDDIMGRNSNHMRYDDNGVIGRGGGYFVDDVHDPYHNNLPVSHDYQNAYYQGQPHDDERRRGGEEYYPQMMHTASMTQEQQLLYENEYDIYQNNSMNNNQIDQYAMPSSSSHQNQRPLAVRKNGRDENSRSLLSANEQNNSNSIAGGRNTTAATTTNSNNSNRRSRFSDSAPTTTTTTTSNTATSTASTVANTASNSTIPYEEDSSTPIKLINIPKKKPRLPPHQTIEPATNTRKNNPFLQSTNINTNTTTTTTNSNSAANTGNAAINEATSTTTTTTSYDQQQPYYDPYTATTTNSTSTSYYGTATDPLLFDPMTSTSTSTMLLDPSISTYLLHPLPFQPINNRTKHQTKEILAKQRQQYEELQQLLHYSPPPTLPAALPTTTTTTTLPIQPTLSDLPTSSHNGIEYDYSTMSKAERRRLKRKEKMFQSQENHVQSIHYLDEEMDAIGNELIDVKQQQGQEADEAVVEEEEEQEEVKKLLLPEDLEDGEVDE